VLGWLRRRRRARVRARPVPPEWRALQEKNVPYFARLTPADQAELLGHVQVFLHEKQFEGCGGLTVTEEMRVTIAGQACLLLLHQPDPGYFADARTILVYPHAYQAPGEQRLPDGTVVAGPVTRLGEAWRRGEVVLAWDAAQGGAADPRDGHNLVLHEFAHKLDMEDGAIDGAPPLPQRARYLAWARALAPEFRALQARAERGGRGVLDPYGATNPAEFFAVATECFFEKSRQLQRKHPELYAQLAAYYRQDPAAPRRGG
jgi:hypothetical protein